ADADADVLRAAGAEDGAAAAGAATEPVRNRDQCWTRRSSGISWSPMCTFSLESSDTPSTAAQCTFSNARRKRGLAGKAMRVSLERTLKRLPRSANSAASHMFVN